MSEKASKESQYSFAPPSSAYAGVGGVIEAIDKSLFEIVIGQQPMTPHTPAMRYTEKSLATYKLAKGCDERFKVL